jgi:hypothetical protein
VYFLTFPLRFRSFNSKHTLRSSDTVFDIGDIKRHIVDLSTKECIIIIIIIITTISFMQGIYTYIPETNNVPKEYSVAAILSLLFMVPLLLVLLLLLLLLGESSPLCLW